MKECSLAYLTMSASKSTKVTSESANITSESARVYIEGVLLKRQRGRSAHPHTSLKFQQRFCRITQPSLKYYDLKHIRGQPGHNDKPKGDFPMERIKIVEEVSREVFGKDFCFQIGDRTEVMYFIASSSEKRKQWMKELRQFAADNGNKMLEMYHNGVFTRSGFSSFHSSWSCCKNTKRSSAGCQTTNFGLQPADSHHQLLTSSSNDKPDDFILRQQNPRHSRRTIDSGFGSEYDRQSIVSRSDSLSGSPPTEKTDDYVVLKLKHSGKENGDFMYAFIPADQSTKTLEPVAEAITDHSGNTETLVEGKVEPSFRDSTLHDLESHNESGDHPSLHSYTLSHSFHTSGNVTALVFSDDSTLVSGSTERSVKIWDVQSHTPEGNVKTPGETSSLSMCSNFLAIGSQIVQLVDFSTEKRRKTFVADKVLQEDPPMQLVAFGPQGHLTTVNCERRTVKVWPPPSEAQEFLTQPLWSRVCSLNSAKNFLCSLSVSTNEEQPWLVVGESAGCVHLLNWKEEEKTYHILFPEDSRIGVTSTAVTYCGQNVAAGCGGCLVTWKIDSRDAIFVVRNHLGDQTISGLCYSPDDAHLAVGMSTGEVVVYDSWTGVSIFTFKGSQNGISAMAYSGSGSYFAAGYNNGNIQLWTTRHFASSQKNVEQGFGAHYCLTQAVPKHMTEGKYTIHFILSDFLKPSMEMIKKQYSGTHRLNHTAVTFSTQGSDPCIRVEFERKLPNGWTITSPSRRSIHVKDVYFLGKELELALKYKQFPPNIVLDAHGEKATGDAVLDIKLIGADEDLEQEIPLKKSGPYNTTIAVQTSIECSEDLTTGKHTYCYLQPPERPSSLDPQLCENFSYPLSTSPPIITKSRGQPSGRN